MKSLRDFACLNHHSIRTTNQCLVFKSPVVTKKSNAIIRDTKINTNIIGPQRADLENQNYLPRICISLGIEYIIIWRMKNLLWTKTLVATLEKFYYVNIQN